MSLSPTNADALSGYFLQDAVGSISQTIEGVFAIITGKGADGLKEGFAQIDYGIVFVLIAFMVALFSPSSAQIFCLADPIPEGDHHRSHSSGGDWLKWRPSVLWGVVCGVLLLLSTLSLVKEQPFIYFQF